MTQLVIGHLVRSWNIPLPERIRDKLTSFAEEACSSDMWKNWATRSLVESDISTLPESRSALGSFPEIIQRKIREGVLHEMKDKNLNLYEAIRSDIRTMRICKLLRENPKVEEQFTLEESWQLEEMAKAFPKVAEYTKNGLNQEVTLLVDEDPIAVMKGRECPHETVG